MGERMLHKQIRLILVGLLISCATLGKKDPNEGVEVKLRVVDESGGPITTAVVRHPDEADPHRVNSMSGEWNGSVLYLPGGGEIVFQPGMHLRLEVSAPGYLTRVIGYDIQRRKNEFEVTLNALNVDDMDIVQPTLEFGRDKPREGSSIGGAN